MKKRDYESADRQDENDFIICPMLSYNYWTDNDFNDGHDNMAHLMH